jgi:hypothetical protein
MSNNSFFGRETWPRPAYGGYTEAIDLGLRQSGTRSASRRSIERPARRADQEGADGCDRDQSRLHYPVRHVLQLVGQRRE